ncbi:MAG TPA: hypothetical protein VMT39_01435 [Candidatus Bathyarchaeia archaeon]|nr:hypothetical protein [Candidatus Bathyarchaeia archaeon]
MITGLKLLYLVAANWLAYLAVVRPRMARGGLVLFDRYFVDCIVDPKRYRIPETCGWMLELTQRILPKPDLYVVLDAPVNVLRERKQEVTPTEAERQRMDYQRLAVRLPHAVVVNAAQPLAEVVDEVVERSIERHLGCRGGVFEAA